MTELLKHNQEQWKRFLTSQGDQSVTAENPEHILCELSDWELLVVEGQDATTFLQGQISCDIAQCITGKAILGACINVKGRVIANFIAINTKENNYVLACPAGNGENLYKVLKKYAVFSKVELHFDNGTRALALTDQSMDTTDIQCHQFDLQNSRQIGLLLDSPAKLEELWLKQAKNQKAFPSSFFSLLCIENVLVFIKRETSELFTAQEINLDLSDGISFTKGCYTGQEVVARLHYRGVPKRRVYLAKLNTTAHENLLGQQVIDESGKEQGHIVAMDETGQSRSCLVSINRSAFEAFQKGTYKLKLAGLSSVVEHISAPPYPLDQKG